MKNLPKLLLYLSLPMMLLKWLLYLSSTLQLILPIQLPQYTVLAIVLIQEPRLHFYWLVGNITIIIQMVLLTCKYRIAGKFGRELNFKLVVWRSILQPPN